ncbi:MAG: hypothetical protein GY909_07930 [Oligoflexia bacterium]|nr:hypothetical protein [Oligoflexia bacterium]
MSFKTRPSLVLVNVIFLFSLLASSCSQVVFKSNQEIPVFISPAAGHDEYFKTERSQEFYFFGTIPSTFDIEVDAIARSEGFTSVANMTVTSYQTWSDWLKSIFSLGFYTPKTIRIEGFGLGRSDD